MAGLWISRSVAVVSALSSSASVVVACRVGVVSGWWASRSVAVVLALPFGANAVGMCGVGGVPIQICWLRISRARAARGVYPRECGAVDVAIRVSSGIGGRWLYWPGGAAARATDVRTGLAAAARDVWWRRARVVVGLRRRNG